MKVNFEEELKGIKGNTIYENNPLVNVDEIIKTLINEPTQQVIDQLNKMKKGDILTLKLISVNALLLTTESDKNLSGKDKLLRGELARRIYNNTDNPIDVSAEEIVLIKDRINKMYSVEVVYVAYALLEKDEK